MFEYVTYTNASMATVALVTHFNNSLTKILQKSFYY